MSHFARWDAHALLPAEAEDSLGNRTTVANDYRVLAPVAVTDPNRNRSMVTFDALGMVVATAVMGKAGELVGDELVGFPAEVPLAMRLAFLADPHGNAAALLGRATSRIVYDLDRYGRAGQPPLTATLMRETHWHDEGGTASKVQIAFSYSDGFGREIQRKVQAEAGDAPQRLAVVPLPSGDLAPGELVRDAQGRVVLSPVARRWVGTGRTVFNNKGKPVKQYEPFFSSTPLYEPERELTDTGVTPVLFYDPAERVVATLHPNHAYDKVVFDAWQETTSDANDTVLSDPRTDADISGYVAGYFATQPASWRTWYEQRIDGQLGAAERDAAVKTAAHADTPTRTRSDSLGRAVLSLAHNRYVRGGVTIEETYATRTKLDIENNQRAVIDAKGRVVMRYAFDLLSQQLHQSSMEAGARWVLQTSTGQPLRGWDSRGFVRRMTYDTLRRPVGLYVTEGGVERLAERTVYGEGQGDAKNHKTRAYQVFDGAGVVTSVEWDFKGNLSEGRRELLSEYRTAVDWQSNPALTGGSFTHSTTYDALSRAITATSPDASVQRSAFNEANLLDKLDANLRGAATSTAFVTNIDYDAKGQRVRIAYGNGAVTTYEYEPLTFRLSGMRTTRPASPDSTAALIFRDPGVVQDLKYTYDPAGNITRIEDSSLRTLFYNNEQVLPVSRYVYDATYRLIEAQGREHIGQNAFEFNPADGNYRDFPFVGIRINPNDVQALRNYTQRYEYDEVGNFLVFRHQAGGSGWTRYYEYEEQSQLEPDRVSNRLSRTILGNGGNHVEPYTYDAHGNMTSMPHLPVMAWDFKDQLQSAGAVTSRTSYYVYSFAGDRVSKTVDVASGVRARHRLYLDGVEIYSEFNAAQVVLLARESLQINDDSRAVALIDTLIAENGAPSPALLSVVRYKLSNHLASESVELGGSGELLSLEEFCPYGSSSFQVSWGVVERLGKRTRYTSKERDEETGLHYYGARLYVSWLGWWCSCDPAKGSLSDPLSLHRYLYVHANPIKFNDPDGRAINLAAAAIGGVVGAIGGAIVGAINAKPGERWAAAGKGALIGAGTGALAGLTFGASLAIGGGVVVAGGAAGAVGGGTHAAITAWSEGASAKEIAIRGVIGAAVGTVGGLAGGGSGVLTNNLAKSLGVSMITRTAVSGGVGGFTGDAAAQGTMIASGLQNEYSLKQGLTSTVLGVGGAAVHAKATEIKGAQSGRNGTQKTRDQLNAIAANVERRGWRVTNGGDRRPEEYISGPNGSRKGSSYPDITATKNGKTLRVNTVDTYSDGVTPTKREATNAARIRQQTGEHLVIIPKKK